MNQRLILSVLTALWIGSATAAPITIQGKIKNLPDSCVVFLMQRSGDMSFNVMQAISINGEFTLHANMDSPQASYVLSTKDERGMTGHQTLWMSDSQPNVKIIGTGTDISLWKSNIKTAEQKASDQLAKAVAPYSYQNIKNRASRDSITALRTVAEMVIVEQNPNIQPVLEVFSSNAFFQLIPTAKMQALYDRLTPTNQASMEGEIIKAAINPPAKIKLGQPYLDFEMGDSLGNKHMLSDYVGKGKYVLIDFWATACFGCIQSIPDMNQLAKDHADHLAVIGINTSTDYQQSARIMKLFKVRMEYPNLCCARGAKTSPFLNYTPTKLGGTPTLALIDPQGRVIGKWLGYDSAEIEALLPKK